MGSSRKRHGETETQTEESVSLYSLVTVEREALQVSCKEIVWGFFLSWLLLFGYICLGLTTGISIIAHYSGDQALTTSVPFKTTLLEVTFRLIAPDADKRLHDVLTTSTSGRQVMLPCLESEAMESDPAPRLEWNWRAPPCRNQPGTFGVSDWYTLREAIHYANNLSAVYFQEWSAYFAYSYPGDPNATIVLDSLTGEDNDFYYEPQWIIPLCPGQTIVTPRKPWSLTREDPIFINSHYLTIRCGNNSRTTPDPCILDNAGGPAHFRLGSHAQVKLSNLILQRAKHASLYLYQPGTRLLADTCHWENNGMVADINASAHTVWSGCDVKWGPNRRAKSALSVPTVIVN